jgi:hypothetical protein
MVEKALDSVRASAKGTDAAGFSTRPWRVKWRT